MVDPGFALHLLVIHWTHHWLLTGLSVSPVHVILGPAASISLGKLLEMYIFGTSIPYLY